MPADRYTDQTFTVLECRAVLDLIGLRRIPDPAKLKSATAKFHRGATMPLSGGESAHGIDENRGVGTPEIRGSAIPGGSIEIPADKNLSFEFDQA